MVAIAAAAQIKLREIERNLMIYGQEVCDPRLDQETKTKLAVELTLLHAAKIILVHMISQYEKSVNIEEEINAFEPNIYTL